MLGRKSENLLIIKTDGLTSFVQAEPLFAAIRDSNPHAKISLLTTPALQRIARAAPYFDQVAALPDFKIAEAKQAFIRQLKGAHFARIFDLSADEESGKLKAALGPFGPKWFTFDPGSKKRLRRGLLDEPADNTKFYAETGVKQPARLPDFRWALSARKDSANMQPSWFGVSGDFGLLLPGPDPERRWPAAHYAQLARKMGEARMMPVLAGGKDLHGIGDEISNDAPEIVDLTGKTDHLQLSALAQEASFFVSDSAEEMHLALSVGCAGVILRKAAEQGGPTGRHIVTLTAREQLGEASAEFVWRTLLNMGLVPSRAARPQPGPQPRKVAR
jgi:ADP-heptose:LPS heptosyltransferase